MKKDTSASLFQNSQINQLKTQIKIANENWLTNKNSSQNKYFIYKISRATYNKIRDQNSVTCIFFQIGNHFLHRFQNLIGQYNLLLFCNFCHAIPIIRWTPSTAVKRSWQGVAFILHLLVIVVDIYWEK